jgi:hypothetical protein
MGVPLKMTEKMAHRFIDGLPFLNMVNFHGELLVITRWQCPLVAPGSPNFGRPKAVESLALVPTRGKRRRSAVTLVGAKSSGKMGGFG